MNKFSSLFLLVTLLSTLLVSCAPSEAQIQLAEGTYSYYVRYTLDGDWVNLEYESCWTATSDVGTLTVKCGKSDSFTPDYVASVVEYKRIKDE